MMSSEFRSAVVLLIAVNAVVNVRVLAVSYVAQLFESNDIVAEVILKAPKDEAVVIYPSGVLVNLGNELTPTQVRDIPTVVYNAAPECFYALALVDPDVPSRVNPVFRESNHWLVVNIPGNYVALGETLTEYVGSAPPIGTGLHRYVFLVYQQPDFLEVDEMLLYKTSAYNRTMFSIEKFAVNYDLGIPIAGNFFQAQYDDYAPILNEQLVPDAPSRNEPKFREFHHWLVGNILGENISTGETLSVYVGSGPPPGTGLHRYVFLVYKLPGKLVFDEPCLPMNSAIISRTGNEIS